MRAFRNISLALLLMINFLFIGQLRAQVKVYGDWKVWAWTDDSTGKDGVRVYTINKTAAIFLECYYGDEFHVNLRGAGLSQLRPGRVRADSKVDNKNTVSNIKGVLVAVDGGSAVRIDDEDDEKDAMLLRHMIKGNQMVLVISDGEGISPTFRFSLRGFTKAYNHVVRNCWK